MRLYREKRPEYFAKIYDDAKKSPQRKFNVYQYRTKRDNINFNLTYEQCERLFYGACVYCGEEIHDGYLHGIDRLYNRVGYIYENCVPCCAMCNYMKCILDPGVFIAICDNILIHLKEIDGQQNMTVMFDRHPAPYLKYKSRAESHCWDFKLTRDQYNIICKQDCYLCGKTINRNHSNGIDRFDNTCGYTHENCRPCCSTCNYIKSDYPYDLLIKHLLQIHQNHQFIID